MMMKNLENNGYIKEVFCKDISYKAKEITYIGYW